MENWSGKRGAVMAVAQAWDRVNELCRRIRRDMRIYEDGRDPQVLDSLVLQLDLLLQHLNRLRAQDEVVEVTSRTLAVLSQHLDENAVRYCRLQLYFMNTTGPGRP